MTLLKYRKQNYEPLPETTLGELPNLAECATAEEAYLTGTHMLQYRDPKGSPELYFRRALELDGGYTPALLGLAECAVKRHDYRSVLDFVASAKSRLLRLNKRPESGRIYYLEALALERLGELETAYDRYFDAAVISDCVNRGYTRLALLDLKNGDFRAAMAHADYALRRDGCNLTAATALALAQYRLGETDAAKTRLEAILAVDPLYHAAKILLHLLYGGKLPSLSSSPTQTCIDVYEELVACGFNSEAQRLLRELIDSGRADAPAQYLLGLEPTLPLGRTFPYRDSERIALERLNSDEAKYLLGCLYFNERKYADAEKIWSRLTSCEALRAHAIALWRRGERDAAVERLASALELRPDDEQLLWELSGLLNRLGRHSEVVRLLENRDFSSMRDDLFLELVHAENKLGYFARARELLAAHEFIPCEGGEPAVTSRYIEAMSGLADGKLANGEIESALALYREAQTIPQNLGAGLWNDAPLMPLIYSEGVCLKKLGLDGADKRFERVISMPVDFFSDGQLRLLPIWQSLALRELGRLEEATALADATLDGWEKARKTVDGGYFSTTPFFDCYIDSPAEARERLYSGLIAEARQLLG